jgi:hypothetical protein
MACLDNDKFNLIEHGNNAGVALQQLLRVPLINTGALGKIIRLIQQEVLTISTFKWVPQTGINIGSAAAFWQVDNAKSNRIKLKEVKVTIMEEKRSQIVHELVHALEMRYYYFNICHPPLAARLVKRVPVLYLFPFGDIFKYNFMDVPFINKFYLDSHRYTLSFFQGVIRNNRILKRWQRDMLMTQLDYARREDKMHAEFTANVAQCLALIYQWGFTGNEKGGLGRPRSITFVIRRMESALHGALESWKRYQPPARKMWSVIQFKPNDPRQPRLQDVHFSKDDWWKALGKDKPELVIAPDRPAGRPPRRVVRRRPVVRV